MNTRKSFRAAMTLQVVLLLPKLAHGFGVQLVTPNAWSEDTAAMDAALGITGLVIEDFEDVSLVPGLQVSTTSPDSGPTGTLPAKYVDGSGFFNINSWDGPGALLNTSDNVSWCSPASCTAADLARIAARITFSLPGARKFGVGLGNFQSDAADHALLVNGAEVVVRIEDLPGFVNGVNARNGYLLITAGPGEVINTVAVEARPNGSSFPATALDGLVFDRVAFEPATGLASLSLKSDVVAGCKSVSGTVTLSQPAPTGGLAVALSDTLASASLPSSVLVPAGATSRSFSIKTTPVSEAQSGEVSAKAGGTTLVRPLTVRPIGVQSVGLSPTSAVGGKSVAGQATLECAAGPGPIGVELASSDAAVAQPVAPSLFVPQGEKSVAFEVATSVVLARSTATLSGTANGITKSRRLTVTPGAVVAPTRLSFVTATGTTSAPQVVTLTNQGVVPVSIDGIDISASKPGAFARTTSCGASLAPGESCTVAVTFTAVPGASWSARLLIKNSATATPLTVALTGTDFA